MSSTPDGLEFLNDIKIAVVQELTMKGLNDGQAGAIAEAVKIEVYNHFRGSILYIPTFKTLYPGTTSRERIVALYEEGKTVKEIIRLTGMGSNIVYDYIRNRNKPEKGPKPLKLTGLKALLTIKMHAARTLLENGIEKTTCKEIGDEVQTVLCRNWGGTTIYFPTARIVKSKTKAGVNYISKQQCCSLLFADYTNGLKPRELAVKYSLVQSTVNSILKRMKSKQEK